MPLLATILSPGATRAQEAEAEGQRLFQQRCGACHQVATTRNGVGPHLQGVMGRAAGSVPGFSASPALRNSGITWSAETMDGFLANPTATVPGTRMAQRFANAEERRAIIAFLGTR
nr:c-type cytochrome [Roseomonas sp. GC11]